MRSERPEGRKRSSSRRSPEALRGVETTALAARARGRGLLRDPLPPATWRVSPPAAGLPDDVSRRTARRRAAHLVLELDAELLAGAAPGFAHQRERVGRCRSAGVFDEVGVQLRDHGAADRVALQTAGLEHAAGAELVVGVLEDTAEGPLVGRLGRLALGDQRCNRRLDLVRRARDEPVLHLGDDCAVGEIGGAIRESETQRRDPGVTVDRKHAGADEEVGPVAAVGAGVHPDAAAGRAGDCAGELEAAETGGAGVVQADRIGRAAACDQQLALDSHGREFSAQLQHERVDALVGGEQV